MADHFFREQLADGGSGKMPPAPVILEMGSLEAADRESPARVDQVNIIGCDGRFWGLFRNNSSKPPQKDEIVLNEPLARLLAVKVGDSVLLSLAKPGAIPAESALGRKRAALDTMRLRVASVIPAEGIGRFTPATQPTRLPERLRRLARVANATSRAGPRQRRLPRRS